MYGDMKRSNCPSPEAEKQAYIAREQEALIRKSPEASSEIVEQLMLQEGSISYLTGMIERLRSKLYPVLLEVPEKSDRADGGTPSQALSPFGQTLNSHTHRIQFCTAEIEKLLRQLSV